MDFIDSYRDIFGIRKFASLKKLAPGSVVQFTYDREQKYALVLNPEWEGKMHALSLKYLSRDSLVRLFVEIKELNDTAEALYERYKISEYAESRPYRTYTISKISALREIYLKDQKKNKSEEE
jgi:hypothetical protein